MTEYRLLAIFAHPDDETFRPGGTLALLAQSGVRVQVLTMTRGEAGSCGDPPICIPEELPAVRESELRCACVALGLELPHLLNYQDGHLAEADTELITAQILKAINEFHPRILLSFGPDGLSGHPDHIVVGHCASMAFSSSNDVVALYTMAIPYTLAEQMNMSRIHPVPDEQISLSVDISPTWLAKQNAMACHATQRSTTPIMSAPAERQQQFFGREYFVRSACRRPEQDFMSGVLKKYCV
jgi:LmbE family N-acetylglucosaminyl deacetylase